jgi:predicted amidohydrolase
VSELNPSDPSAQVGDKSPLRLAVAQFNADSGDLAGNVAQHIVLLEEAARQNAALVLFPELSLTGYCSNLLDLDATACAVDPAGTELAELRTACARFNIYAVVGAPVLSEDGLHLSTIVIGRQGNQVTCYHKMYLDRDEKGWFVPGNHRSQFEVDGWELGLGICYDSSFPEHARGYALSGADVYLLSGAFPLGRSDFRRSIYFPARSLENTIYLAFANYVGSHDGLDYGGMSAVHGPDGQCLGDAGANDSGIAVVDLAFDHLFEIRQNLQMLQDYR